MPVTLITGVAVSVSIFVGASRRMLSKKSRAWTALKGSGFEEDVRHPFA
jgi:hypothetical protein